MMYVVTQDRTKMYAVNYKIYIHKVHGGDKYELRISHGNFSDVLGEYTSKQKAMSALEYIYAFFNSSNVKVAPVPEELNYGDDVY